MVKEPFRLVTLRTVATIAAILFRLRVPLLIVALAAAGWFSYTLVNPGVASETALLALAVSLWSALGLCAGYTLVRLPSAIESDDHFGRRIVKRLVWLAYSLTLAVTIGLGGFALFLSVRAVKLAII